MEAPQLFSRLWTQPASSSAPSPQGKLILPKPRDTLHDILDDYDQDDDELPPAPPPKDPGYNAGFSRSQTSLVPPRTPYSASAFGGASSSSNLASSYIITDKGPGQTVIASSSSPSSSQPSLSSPSPTTLTNVKAAVSKFRLPRLKRKPSALGISSNDRPPTSDSACSDEGISQPWNFQHNVHVDEALAGLPHEWSNTLRQAGYTVEEIKAMHARHPPPTPAKQSSLPLPPPPPHSQAGPSRQGSLPQPQVIIPRPRQDSLRKGDQERTPTDTAPQNVNSIPGSARTPQPLLQPISASDHNRDMSDGSVTISVATTVRRTPSTLKRIAVPSVAMPSPPPPYEHPRVQPSLAGQAQPPSSYQPPPSFSNQQSQSSSSQPSASTSSNQPSSSTSSPHQSPGKSTKSFRAQLTSKLSQHSLRSKRSRSDSIRTSSSSGRRSKSNTKEGTFWDDEAEEEEDEVPPLPVRKFDLPAEPPKLELELGASGRGRGNPDNFLSFDFGGGLGGGLGVGGGDEGRGSFDLGLGDWGKEILSAVSPGLPTGTSGTFNPSTSTPASGSSKPVTTGPSATSSTSSSATLSVSTSATLPPLTLPTDTLSALLATPASQQTTFSGSSAAPATPTNDTPMQRHISLLPIVPLSLPPKGKQQLSFPVPPSTPGLESMESRTLSILISEEYDHQVLEDSSDEEEDERLPYMRSPGPGTGTSPTAFQTTFPALPLPNSLQTTFPTPPSPNSLQTTFVNAAPPSSFQAAGASMTRSASSSTTSGSSSRGTSLASSATSSNISHANKLANRVTITPARPVSTLTLTPEAVKVGLDVKSLGGERPVSVANGSNYDTVLDDYLDSSDEEEGEEEEEEEAQVIEIPSRIALPPVAQGLAKFLSSGTTTRRHQDLQQIAEGQSGAVYAASSNVAVKVVPATEFNRSKFDSLKNELALLENIKHPNVLVYEAVYLVGAEVWLEMQLMERSLADVLAFLPAGLEIGESLIARFANDILEGLDYLQSRNIAHRDVRSDSLLISKTGVLKLADFSSGVITSPIESKRVSTQGQPPYWMAPEMLRGLSYDPHEADVWSCGATCWEIAEGDPPFIEIEDPRQFLDTWPPLEHEEGYTQAFHDFLGLCSKPAGQRPRAVELLRTAFVKSAASRGEVVHLLSRVRELEEVSGP